MWRKFVGSQEKWSTIDLCEFSKVECSKKYPYPLPFTNEILNIVASHETYSFLDDFFEYFQISIAPKD